MAGQACRITVIDNDNKRSIYYTCIQDAEMILKYYRRKCRLRHRIYRYFVRDRMDPLIFTKYNCPAYLTVKNLIYTIHDLKLDLKIDEMSREYGPMPAMQGKATAILEDHFFKAGNSKECKAREVKCTEDDETDNTKLHLCDCSLKLDILLITYIIENKMYITLKLSEGCENILQSKFFKNKLIN